MSYFLKIEEIKGASKIPAFKQQIELLSFQKISETELEIAVSPAEFVATMLLYEYVGNQSLKISKAVLTTVVSISLFPVASTIEMRNVLVTKTHLSAGGSTFFTLGANAVKTNQLRDPANGLPTGKRMHKPFIITKELDKSEPIPTNEHLEFYKRR